MSKEKIYNKMEDIKGKKFHFGNDSWLLQIDDFEYRLTPIIQFKDGPRLKDKSKIGKYHLNSERAKHFRKLRSMLPLLRRWKIARDDIETLTDLVRSMEQFNDWARKNFEVKVKGDL